MLQSVIELSKLVIFRLGINVLINSIINEGKLTLFDFYLKFVGKHLLIRRDEALFCYFLALCSLVYCPLAIIELCHAYKDILEEIFAEHLREEKDCCLKIVTQTRLL
jgi:hypothetical protein